MKKKLLFAFAIAVVALNFLSLTLSAQDNIRGFLVDMKIVKMITDKGASGVKIFAASDDQGRPYYIMAGIDASGGLLPGKVYRQNETGDCPPYCDFLPTALTNGGAFIDTKEAQVLVNNYLELYKTIENAVTVCDESLSKVREKNYNYMRVTFERKVKISGVKDDGKVLWFAPFSKSCNALTRSSLEDK